MGRKNDYLIKKPDSRFWQVRFQYPGFPSFPTKVRSLRTEDRAEAELRAAPLIHRHKLLRQFLSNSIDATVEKRRSATLRKRYEPGRWPVDDGLGTWVTASQDTLMFDRPGCAPWSEPNFEWAQEHDRLPRSAHEWRMATSPEYAELYRTGHLRTGFEDEEPPIPAPKKVRAQPNADDAIIERYIEKTKPDAYGEDELRDGYALFKELTGNKPLKDCDRDDGAKLVKHFQTVDKNKSGTIRKKISRLAAAVNLAIDDKKLRFNPFTKIVPDLDDATEREPMPEEDVKRIRENEHTFDDREWLLYLLCETTGMRREEAYSISRDYVESGIRFVIVGKKTKQSKRRVPFPDAVIPYLPDRITQPLFSPDLITREERKKDLKNLGREVLRQMKRIGITTPGLHVLRHRAKDRLRAAGITHEQQEELLGHEKPTVADSYGKGYRVPMLKEWIEHIGYGAEHRDRLSFGPKRVLIPGER